MKTLAFVTAALAPTEEILRNEYNRLLTEQADKVLKELAEDGWDAYKRYDLPSGRESREMYARQKARYELAQSLTEWDYVAQPVRNGKGCMVKARTDNAERIAAKASKMAKLALEGYCAKLAAKIDATGIQVSKVEYKGGLSPWSVSSIWVNSVAQEWQTKMIVNISCLGKLFNQWPTRLVK